MKTTEATSIKDAYKAFIVEGQHPCIMANTVFQLNNFVIKTYDDLTDPNVIKPILNDIQDYINNYDFQSKQFESLIFSFPKNNFETEMQFEKALWTFLQRLHNKDNEKWDDNVSCDPNDADFSFSVKGKAFYIIGMHPNSSRLARQAPYCTVVFNLHWQFEKLREMGTYTAVRNRIRKRDEALQGFINPVLKDFGSDTETKQYSGREVESNWKCPFHHNDN